MTTKTATKKEQAIKDKIYAKIFKHAKRTKSSKDSYPVPEMNVIGKTGKQLCKAYLIGGDILFIYNTGRIEMILGMKFRVLGQTLQIIKKTKMVVVDRGAL